MEPAEDQIIIPMDEYIRLLGDRALLQELEKDGLTTMPIYDKAMLQTFLHTSRRYDIEEDEIDRLRQKVL